MLASPVKYAPSQYQQAALVEGQWVYATELEPGDRLRILEGESRRIESVTELVKRVEVFNLEVENGDTFAVGRVGVAVHDDSP